MDWRAILAAPFVASFAALFLLAVLNRRTLIGDRTDELSNQGADEGGRAFIQHNGAPIGE